jgi:hypothetical protein
MKVYKREHAMKITDKIISIPPYISTSWEKVSSMYKKDDDLVVCLKDGTNVTIPHLSEEVITQLFTNHAVFLEQHPVEQKPQHSHLPNALSNVDQLMQMPLKIVFGTLESVAQALQHNPNQRNLPPLPPEIISKVSALGRIIPPEDIQAMPPAEKKCMCMYCQIIRILKGESSDHDSDERSQGNIEEIVTDEELRFEEWDIQPTGEKMYLVTNKLDPSEQYTVFLGDPIGCTCGKPHCEHIIAVLRH